jgi:hypothetical protein
MDGLRQIIKTHPIFAVPIATHLQPIFGSGRTHAQARHIADISIKIPFLHRNFASEYQVIEARWISIVRPDWPTVGGAKTDGA